MKKLLLVLVLLLCAGAATADKIAEEIIARVNNSIITSSDLQRSEEQLKKELAEQYGAQADEQFKSHEKDMLRDLIDRQLLIDKAKDDGVNVDNDVIKRLDEMRKQMNLDSMEDLEKAAAQQGVSFEDFKADIKNNMLTQEVIGQEVGRHIQILPSEAEKYYADHKKEFEHPEQVHLEQILISTEAPAAVAGQAPAAAAQDENAAKAKAADLLEQIKKGANFEDLAKKYSQDPTAEQAGDIGSFQRGQMAKEIEDQVFPLKAGEVAGPIQTKQGFILLKVVEHTPAGVPPYKDVEQQVMNRIYMEKLQPALRAYLTKLREEAYIDIKPGFTDSGASPNESKPTFVSGNTGDEKGAVKQGKRKKKLGIF